MKGIERSTKEWVKKTKKSVQKKLDKWERMLNDDINALWECMYDRGMCNQKEYYEIEPSGNFGSYIDKEKTKEGWGETK